ncbi:MAG: hypothetical protein IJC76_02375 [Lachnospiraceae bacterium]|nr:hypothetical protein [Lachnospiraceae bacterium]
MRKYTKYIIPIMAGIIACTGCASSDREIEKTTEVTTEATTKETVTTQEITSEVTSETTTETTTEATTKETEETTPEETTTEDTTKELEFEETTKKPKLKFREVDEVVYVTRHTYVYVDYSTQSQKKGELGVSNSLKRIGICNGWSMVEFEGDTGYVLTECLSLDKPVEKTMEYYDEQFAGDCFIGDSRTQGLFNTSQIITADFLCSVGQNISDVRSDEKTLNHLKTKKYRNVYIEFGINEMGWSDLDKFERCYEEFVNIVKQYQPNAKIYVQGVIPVTKTKSDSNQTYAPHRVSAFDERIKSVAKKTGAIYLDIAIGICGESRVLPEDVAPDGVHMGKYYNDKWLDYIIENRED